MCKAFCQQLLGDGKTCRTVWVGPLDSQESFNKYFLNTCSLLGTVQGMGDAAINKTDKIPVLSGWGDRQQRNKSMYNMIDIDNCYVGIIVI